MSRRERARHHSRRQLEAAADRGVVTFRDDIHLTIFEVPLRRDARVAGEKAGEQGQDVHGAERRWQADFQRAGRLAAVRGETGYRQLDALEMTGNRDVKGLAGLRQREPSGRTLEQADAEVSFQRGDVSADGSGCQ